MKRRIVGTLFAISAVSFAPATSAQASMCSEPFHVLSEVYQTAEIPAPGSLNFSSTVGKCEDSLTVF